MVFCLEGNLASLVCLSFLEVEANPYYPPIAPNLDLEKGRFDHTVRVFRRVKVTAKLSRSYSVKVKVKVKLRVASLEKMADGGQQGQEQRQGQGQQEQPEQKEEQEHFFSGLANRNLKHVLSNILSYLPAEDIRTCLWSCRTLRQAVRNDRAALNRETAYAFWQIKPDPKRKEKDENVIGMKPWRASKEFMGKVKARYEPDKDKAEKVHDGNEGSLARRANSVWDWEADKVIEGGRKGFLKDWYDDMLYCDKWVQSRMKKLGMGGDRGDGGGIRFDHNRIHGDDLFFADTGDRLGCKGSKPMSAETLEFLGLGDSKEKQGVCDCEEKETYLVRLQDGEDQVGKVLDRMDYVHLAHGEDDQIIRLWWIGSKCDNIKFYFVLFLDCATAALLVGASCGKPAAGATRSSAST